MKMMLFIFLCAGHAWAGLEWKTRVVSLNPHPLQGLEQVQFHYANTGESPVSIVDVNVSCGCLVPDLGSEPIAPGENGVLPVDFDLFGRTGTQRKTLSVVTSDGREVQLTIQAGIPRAFTVSPVLLKFKGDTQAKAVSIRNLTGKPLNIDSVQCNNDRVKVELRTIKEGYVYAVDVLPETDRKIRSVVTIIPESPEGINVVKTFTFYVFADKS